MNRSNTSLQAMGVPLLAVCAALAACSPRAEDGASQVVGGLKLDYGLVKPAPGLPPASHPDPAMHGPPPADPNAYHVVLSVADAKTGQRITDAQAEMGISGPGHPGAGSVRMEPMTVNGQLTYAGYVVLPAKGPYQLRFQVRRPGHNAVGARFVLERPA